eukprot:11623-Heterococcus_DN1.PRE.2
MATAAATTVLQLYYCRIAARYNPIPTMKEQRIQICSTERSCMTVLRRSEVLALFNSRQQHLSRSNSLSACVSAVIKLVKLRCCNAAYCRSSMLLVVHIACLLLQWQSCSSAGTAVSAAAYLHVAMVLLALITLQQRACL